MKVSIVALVISIASAAPLDAPAKFALGVTARGQTLYLAKSLNGDGVADAKQAASCSIANSKLVCGGKTIGVQGIGSLRSVDMAPIRAVNGGSRQVITEGFSVDASNNLHFRNDKAFATLGGARDLMSKQGGEAQFGLWNSPMTLGKTQLYFQLGCPGGTHENAHSELIVGKVQLVAL